MDIFSIDGGDHGEYNGFVFVQTSEIVAMQINIFFGTEPFEGVKYRNHKVDDEEPVVFQYLVM